MDQPSGASLRIGNWRVSATSGQISREGETVRVMPYAELSRLDYVHIVDLGLSGFRPQAVVPQPAVKSPPKPPIGNSIATAPSR